jgi:hypothetical protein
MSLRRRLQQQQQQLKQQQPQPKVTQRFFRIRRCITLDLGGQFNYTTFDVGGNVSFVNSKEMSEKIIQLALTKSRVWRSIKAMTAFSAAIDKWNDDGRNIVENFTAVDELRRGQFEFVIIDPMSMLHYAIPSVLGDLPHAAMSVATRTFQYRVPRLPSFTFNVMFDCGDPTKSFGRRLLNLVLNMAISLFGLRQRIEYRIVDADMIGSDVSPSTKTLYLTDAMRRVSLWFLVEDIAVGHALPLMPNTVPVGDIAARRPLHPLPVELEEFMSPSTGVIVVSFGSFFDFIPHDIALKFCRAFRQLQSEGRRVVWKSANTTMCPGVDNVRIMRWIPQNDLLADHRVVMFISHGGLSGTMEAIYHAKPVIVFPLMADQPSTAHAVESKGFGIRMNIGEFTADSLLHNINKILSDRKYAQNAQLSSSILRDRRDTAAERVSHMINHVIKYGDSHLRTGAFELNDLQFLMFDVYAFICTVTLVTFLTTCFVCRRICVKFCRRNTLVSEPKPKRS